MLIKSCARCGEDHKVEIIPLDCHPKHSHWGICPTKCQPILIEMHTYYQCECGNMEFSRSGYGTVREVVSVSGGGHLHIDKQDIDLSEKYKCLECGKEMPVEWLKA